MDLSTLYDYECVASRRVARADVDAVRCACTPLSARGGRRVNTVFIFSATLSRRYRILISFKDFFRIPFFNWYRYPICSDFTRF